MTKDEEIEKLKEKLAAALEGQVESYKRGYQDGLEMGRNEPLLEEDI